MHASRPNRRSTRRRAEALHLEVAFEGALTVACRFALQRRKSALGAFDLGGEGGAECGEVRLVPSDERRVGFPVQPSRQIEHAHGCVPCRHFRPLHPPRITRRELRRDLRFCRTEGALPDPTHGLALRCRLRSSWRSF